MLNPLFSNNDNDDDDRPDPGFVLSKRHAGRIEPIHKDVRPESGPISQHSLPKSESKPATVSLPVEESARKNVQPGADNPAVELIRRKLDALFANEPNARQEIKEVEAETPRHRSKHQQFMHDLTTSGKSLAEIQTAWHNYYVSLPDNEKHEVWQEFYEANARRPSSYEQLVGQQTAEPSKKSNDQPSPPAKAKTDSEHRTTVFATMPPVLPHREKRTRSAIKRRILDRVSLEAQEKAKRHFRSLLFGLSSGALVLIVFLFSFFNQIIIAPFIQPSRKAEATPIILSSNGVAPTDRNEVIIPKINVEIPLQFSVNTTDENAIENSLEDGVVHYPTTVLPGQKGNAAFFGHSSNNILNPGKYKFAFVLLHTLVPGDIFYITYSGKVYSYQVYQRQIVKPSDVSVLNNVPDKVATATLITCDPPGTSLNRLVVWGEQISPDPAGNTAVAAPAITQTPAALPDEGPSLWSRFIHWLF